MECLLDGNRGIYLPQQFAELYGDKIINKTEDIEEDLNILLAGPDEEWYWEAWDSILQCDIELDGKRYTLYHDDDLFIEYYDKELNQE